MIIQFNSTITITAAMSSLLILSLIFIATSPISAFIMRRDLSQELEKVLPETEMKHVYKRQDSSGRTSDPNSTNNNAENSRLPVEDQQSGASNQQVNAGNQPYAAVRTVDNPQQYSNLDWRTSTGVDQSKSNTTLINEQQQQQQGQQQQQQQQQGDFPDNDVQYTNTMSQRDNTFSTVADESRTPYKTTYQVAQPAKDASKQTVTTSFENQQPETLDTQIPVSSRGQQDPSLSENQPTIVSQRKDMNDSDESHHQTFKQTTTDTVSKGTNASQQVNSSSGTLKSDSEEKRPDAEVLKYNQEPGSEEEQQKEEISDEYIEESTDVSDSNEDIEEFQEPEEHEGATDGSEQEGSQTKDHSSYNGMSSINPKIFDKFLYDSYNSEYDSESQNKLSWLQSILVSSSSDEEEAQSQWQENRNKHLEESWMAENESDNQVFEKFGSKDHQDEVSNRRISPLWPSTFKKKDNRRRKPTRVTDDSFDSSFFLLYSLPVIILILLVFTVWRNLRGRVKVIKITPSGDEKWNPDFSKQIAARAKEIEPMLMENEKNREGWQ